MNKTINKEKKKVYSGEYGFSLKQSRRLVGYVAVDSGCLMITDPAYKDLDRDFEGKEIIFPSGMGDGTYNVYVTKTDLGKFGKRVSKVEIILISDQELKEYEDDEGVSK